MSSVSAPQGAWVLAQPPHGPWKVVLVPLCPLRPFSLALSCSNAVDACLFIAPGVCLLVHGHFQWLHLVAVSGLGGGFRIRFALSLAPIAALLTGSTLGTAGGFLICICPTTFCSCLVSYVPSAAFSSAVCVVAKPSSRSFTFPAFQTSCELLLFIS